MSVKQFRNSVKSYRNKPPRLHVAWGSNHLGGEDVTPYFNRPILLYRPLDSVLELTEQQNFQNLFSETIAFLSQHYNYHYCMWYTLYFHQMQ